MGRDARGSYPLSLKILGSKVSQKELKVRPHSNLNHAVKEPSVVLLTCVLKVEALD